MRWHRFSAAPLCLLVILSSSPAAGNHVDLSELYQILPWDVLHTITNPQFNDRPYVSAFEEVFGVTIGNESHTYPVKLMHYHEVIDDVVGGVPVVVSYCPLCGTAIAYERTVGGEVLTFRTSGYLFRNNKVMFDVQTGSLWPQILGEAINGTYHGTRLTLVSSSRMPFGEWMALHPDAKVVARPWGPVLCPFPCPVPPGFEGYDVNPYADYQAANWTYAPILSPDARLHPKTFVVGVVSGGDAWAVAFPDLLAHRAVNAVVGGTPIVAAIFVNSSHAIFPPTSAHVYARDGRSYSVDNASNELVDEAGHRYAIVTGAGTSGALEPLPFFYGFWFAWHDVHPETRLFGYERIEEPQLPYVGLVLIVGGVFASAAAVAAVVWRRRSTRSS